MTTSDNQDLSHKDRDYYRGLSNNLLIEEQRRGVRVNWQELSVVLAERLHAEGSRSYDYDEDC
jgi:hypothetical protein